MYTTVQSGCISTDTLYEEAYFDGMYTQKQTVRHGVGYKVIH